LASPELLLLSDYTPSGKAFSRLEKPVPLGLMIKMKQQLFQSGPAKQSVPVKFPIVSLWVIEGKMQSTALFSRQSRIHDQPGNSR
jgi:hypothetical protein